MRNITLSLILFNISILLITLLVGCNTIKTTNKTIANTKTIYSRTLKTLVANNTISQAQSDKVLNEVLKNVSESKGCIDKFNRLLESGIINKLQADEINKNIQIDMKKDMYNK